MGILADFTSSIEPLGLDEAYLDVTHGGKGYAREVALQLKRRVREELNITASVGIAACKIVAKVASDLAKPDGLLEITSGRNAFSLLLCRLPSCLGWAGEQSRY